MSPRAGFVLVDEVVPRLRAAIPQAACRLGCEDIGELVQDATAMAGRLLHSAERAGKRPTGGNIAYYTIQHIRSGRRSTGSSVVDAIAAGTQLASRTRLTSLEEVAACDLENGGEIFTFADVLSRDQEDPATKAARRIDWECFYQAQPARNRAILVCLAGGEPLTELAKKQRVSRTRLQQNKNRLAQDIKEFMGDGILQETARLPLWKHNVSSTRERTAWKKTTGHLDPVPNNH